MELRVCFRLVNRKSEDHLKLFRSPLAIDPRRTVPPLLDPNPDIVINPNNGPLHVKAWAKLWKKTGNVREGQWPNFKVVQTGPIVLDTYDCTKECVKIR